MRFQVVPHKSQQLGLLLLVEIDVLLVKKLLLKPNEDLLEEEVLLLDVSNLVSDMTPFHDLLDHPIFDILTVNNMHLTFL